MSRLAIAIVLTGVGLGVVASPVIAGDFSIGGFYDPYARDSLVADRDLVFAQIIVTVAFRNGNPATEFCDPCP